VVIATFLSMLAYFSWVIASPIGGSPDESYYLAGIWCSDGSQANRCEIIEESSSVLVPTAIYPQCFPHWQEISAGCVGSVSKNDFAKVDAAPPGILQSIQSFFVSETSGQSVLLIRSFLFAIVFSSLLLVMRFLDAKHRFATALVFGVAFVPMGMYLMTSINPSGLAIGMTVIGAMAFSQLVKNGFSTTNRIPLLMIYSSAILISWLSRKEATIALLICSFLLLVFWIHGSRIVIRRNLYAALIGLSLVLVFIATQGKKLGVDVSFILVSFPVETNSSVAPWNVLSTNVQNFPSILIGNFGYWGLGAIDTPMPIFVWASVSMIVAALVGIALATGSKQVILQFIALLASTVLIILFILQRNLIYVGDQLQPRYIAPLFLVSLGILFANTNWLKVEAFQLQFFKSGLVLVMASANSIALWTLLRRYISGLDVGELDLTWQQEWWWNIPISPNQVWLLGTLSFGSAFYIALSILLQSHKTVEVSMAAKI
jgi:hypothetical protein